MLKSQTRNQILISDLKVATSFWARGKGLLGLKSLGAGQALWIHQCNSIHTFFMRFSIDCVFLDKELRIRKIYEDVRPFRLILPVWGAKTVIEFPAGKARDLQLQTGEALHVGH